MEKERLEDLSWMAERRTWELSLSVDVPVLVSVPSVWLECIPVVSPKASATPCGVSINWLGDIVCNVKL